MDNRITEFIDAVGTEHSPAAPDARIVSLVPSITELVADLGLAHQLVGRTQWCIHPKGVVDSIPTLGGTKKINLEKLRELAPTHVIVNIDENTREMADALVDIVPNMIVTHPIEPRDNLSLYRLVGGIFGRGDEADALCTQFEQAYERLAKRSAGWPARRVLYLIWKDPWMTVSRDTYIARTLDLIGWKTIGEGDARYPQIEIDADVVAATDLVLFSSEPFSFTEAHIGAFAEDFGCGREKLLLIDGEMTSWYGSRAIRGLGYLGELVERYAGR